MVGIFWKLVKWCWTGKVTPAYTPVHFLSKVRKQSHSLQWVHLGEDLLITPALEEESLRLYTRKFHCERSVNASQCHGTKLAA